MIQGLEYILCGVSVIADGTPAGGIVEGGIKVNGERLQQIEDIVRSTFATGFARGNKKTMLEFLVSYQQSTNTAALDQSVGSNDDLAEQANFTLQFLEGTNTYTCTSSGALWKVKAAPIMGVTAKLTYSVTCFGFTRQNVTGSPAAAIDGNASTSNYGPSIDGGSPYDNQALAVVIDGN